MRIKHLPIMILALFLLGTASVYATSLWGEYKGYNKTRVSVNDQVIQFDEREVAAFEIEGVPVMPLPKLGESLGAVVDWDPVNYTVSVYKPNVDMFIAKSVTGRESKDGIDYFIRSPFGYVVQGDKFDFYVFAQVDSLKTEITSFKISIETPGGQEIAQVEETLTGHQQRESFWYPAPFHLSFDETGDYRVKFSIKTDSSGDYVAVSEKLIVSEQPKK